MGFYLAVPISFSIFIIGIIIEKIKEKFGILAAIILHMGIDVAIVIVFADLILNAIEH